ncbi:MAG: protein disulfide oxidoreductase [Campylobacterota bacterium]|nr:protein disulfide oxidoreductase [Campylobacterota bacterium]
MQEKIKKYSKEFLFFIISVFVISNLISLYKSQDLNSERFILKNLTLIDGKKYKVPLNKPTLVHFWATWCPTCKMEASNIEKLSKDYEVITIAVQSGDDKKIKAYLKENNLSFKVLNDNKGIYAKKFNIEVFPTTFIYDKNQELVFSEVGYTSTLGLKLRMFWASLDIIAK